MKRVDGNRRQVAGVGREVNLRPEFVKILKTMLLLERAYGPSYILHLIKGSERVNPRQAYHLTLETFGSCSLVPFDRLRCTLYQMVSFGLVSPKQPSCNVIEITQTGLQYLDEPTDVLVPKHTMEVGSFQTFFSMKLKAWRSNRALADNCEKYAVLPEYTLDQLAMQQAKTVKALAEVPGMNVYKAETYGSDLLSLLEECHQLFKRIKDDQMLRKTHAPSHQRVKLHFEKGMDVDEIAKVSGLKENTVRNYLQNLHLVGEINLKPWIEKHVDKKVLFKGAEYFQKVKSPRLKEAFETLGIDYDTLKLCRLYVSDHHIRKDMISVPA